MGNQPSHIERSPQPHRYNRRRNSRTLSLASTVLPDQTVGEVDKESRMTLDIDVDGKAEPWITETGSEAWGSTPTTRKSSPCPTELPPPRTMEAARKLLARLCVVYRKRHLEVRGLVTGLGGDCTIVSSRYDNNYCDGHLAFELKITEYELGDLDRAMSNGVAWTLNPPVVWSPKLLGDVFGVLDGYGRVIEDIVNLCGKMREMQTGEKLPEPSDLKWLKENVTPEAVKLAERLKHLLSRSQVVRFDIEQASSGF